VYGEQNLARKTREVYAGVWTDTCFRDSAASSFPGFPEVVEGFQAKLRAAGIGDPASSNVRLRSGK
jgi:hypothetical protein